VSEQQSALFISDFLATELPKLAAKHKICQTGPLLLALLEAAVVYWGGNWVIQSNSQFAGKPDTLNKLPKAIDAVIALLEEPVNRYRLERNPTREIYHELCERQSTKESCVKTLAFSMQSLPLPASLYLDDFILICLKYRRWAIAADQGRGKPPGKQPLIFAYNRLVTFWLEDGPAKFTNTWQQTECGKLEPVSHAACFLCDELNLICPKRDNIAQELRTLMAKTISARNLC